MTMFCTRERRYKYSKFKTRHVRKKERVDLVLTSRCCNILLARGSSQHFFFSLPPGILAYPFIVELMIYYELHNVYIHVYIMHYVMECEVACVNDVSSHFTFRERKSHSSNNVISKKQSATFRDICISTLMKRRYEYIRIFFSDVYQYKKPFSSSYTSFFIIDKNNIVDVINIILDEYFMLVRGKYNI